MQKTYLFKTNATMKENDSRNWWIDKDIISDKHITAESLKDALKNYAKAAEENGVSISENAIKNKNGMYIDMKDGTSKQIGYVITGKTSFENSIGKWIDKYVDLWIDIFVIENPNFDDD